MTAVPLRSSMLPSGILLLTLDRPPVNALSLDVREALLAEVGRAALDSSVRGCVITGAGNLFSAGADIGELAQAPMPPSLPDVLAAIEGSPKPVVAALNGAALGGGCELALVCHARIGAPNARLGLPEIKLGLIPGAGGTQRLPRLIDMETAVAMILEGEPLEARRALEVGLIDQLIDASELVAAAEARVLALAEGRAKRAEARPQVPAEVEALIARARKAKGRVGSPSARAAALDALLASQTLPLNEGLARERELFQNLKADPQSAALRHIFKAKRQAGKVAGLKAGLRPLESAAVIGAGTMGAGIAMCFSDAGMPVSLIDSDDRALAAGLSRIGSAYAASVKKGAITQEEADRRIALVQPTVDLQAAVAKADVVVEAVFESMDVKAAVFGAIDAAARPGTLLATNTSYLDVDEIAAFTSRPEDVIGLHFFSPAQVMKLLEIVRTKQTSDEVLASSLALGKRLGKTSVVVGVCHGFVGNRMLGRRSPQAERLLLEGALPQDIDAAITAFGFPMGPFAVSDMSGLDIGMRMRQARGLRAEIADALCAMGRFGQKTGAGFYRYSAGSRQAEPDPIVENLIVERSEALGITRRTIGVDELVDRLVLPLIDEGAKILAEGIAVRPDDIDVIWIDGYGFPAWRGGPMFYGAQMGFGRVVDRLDDLARFDPTLAPSDALRDLVRAAA